jgi:hypothetical protein
MSIISFTHIYMCESLFLFLSLVVWFSTDVVDFGLTQLDTKKKVRAKLGEGILLRLRFTQGGGGGSPVGGGGGGSKKYALVTGEADLGTDSYTHTLGALGAGVTADADADAASEDQVNVELVPMPTSAGSSSSSSAKGGSAKLGGPSSEIAFTSLVTNAKP